ncbi:MAG TPA: hypothetical protein VGD67_25680 [Pseudonocardiaceae bacterium]
MPVVGKLTEDVAPARQVIRRYEDARARLGNENHGFLSERYGFMPVQEPLQNLPDDFAEWDHVTARLPELHGSARLRRELDGLPVLDAGRDRLPDSFLLRAALVLSHAAHWTRRSDGAEPGRPLPASLERPWTQVRQRLAREAPAVSLLDVLYNWQVVDPDQRRRGVDNLRLLVPAVYPGEEQLTAVRVVTESTPAVAAMVRAHEAVLADDTAALEFELMVVLDGLRRVRGPRGAANQLRRALPGTPMSTALAVFLGRGLHRLDDGGQPGAWRDFFHALGAISVPAYAANRGNRGLTALLGEVTEVFAAGRPPRRAW